MKTKHLIQKLTCVVLVPSILLMSACSAQGQPEESTNDTTQPPAIERQGLQTYAPYTGKTRKSETVYVTMDAKGNVSKKIVTDWLHTEQAGVQVADQSDLDGIQNIKSDVKPVQKGNQIAWNMDSTDLYYKGESQKDLPVDISIRYYLDGAEIEPSDLAGKSGKVKIEIQMKNTQPHTVNINGREAVIYTPVAALGGMLLPEEKFQNIKMENGATLGDGSKQLAVFIALPGLHDSLDLASMPIEELKSLTFPETFTLTADVKDFELDNMYFAMTTDIPALDLSKASGQLSEIKKSLYALNDMQNAVEQLDPDHVLRSLLTDGDNMREMRSLMEELTSIYEKEKALLDLLPQYFTKENLALVGKLAKDADAAELTQLLGDTKLLSCANQLLDSSLIAAPAQRHIQRLAGQHLSLVEVPFLAAHTNGHGGRNPVAGNHAADLIQNGKPPRNDPPHIPLLNNGDIPVLFQLPQQAMVFLSKGLNDMLDLAHDLAALVFLGVGKQLSVVVDNHQQHRRAGIKIFLGIIFQVVVIHQIGDKNRLCTMIGPDDISAVLPTAHSNIDAAVKMLRLKIHLRQQLEQALVKQVLPLQHHIPALVVDPNDLPILPGNNGSHGKAGQRILLGSKQRFPQAGKKTLVVPTDEISLDQHKSRHQQPHQTPGEKIPPVNTIGKTYRYAADQK